MIDGEPIARDGQSRPTVGSYRFHTIWSVAAPLQAVWDVIFDAERWPEWWRGVEQVRALDHGRGELKIGSRTEQVWRSRLPYSVRFETVTDRVEPLRLIEGRAEGDLRGTGVWRFDAASDGTTVSYDWHVETTSRRLNKLAPLARPVFRWNHDWVMRQGGKGLAERAAVTDR